MKHIIPAAVLLLGVARALAADPHELPDSTKTPGVVLTAIPDEPKLTSV